MYPSSFTASTSTVVDLGRVRVGAGLKLRPALKALEKPEIMQIGASTPSKMIIPVNVADANRVRVGAGLKRR